MKSSSTLAGPGSEQKLDFLEQHRVFQPTANAASAVWLDWSSLPSLSRPVMFGFIFTLKITNFESLDWKSRLTSM